MKFSSFALKKEILSAIDILGFKECTPVQEKTIPVVLKGANVLVRSETGSGKTHSFLIPIINNIKISNPGIQAMIISPTRELAKQTYDFAVSMAKHISGLTVKLFSGGNERSKEGAKSRRAAQIIVGTPGRLVDLFVKGEGADPTSVKFIVVDEADMLFEMGYLEDIHHLLGISSNSQKLIFSATFPQKIKNDLLNYVSINETIEIGKSKTSSNVSHIAIDRKHTNLKEATLKFIRFFNPYYLFIFCSKKSDVVDLYDFLTKQGLCPGILHGDLSMRERKTMIKRIRNDDFKIVVCSDMASRGMDIKNISTILNYDLPNDLSFYFHRAGRSGRFDEKGSCYSFFNIDSIETIKKLQSMGISFSFLSLKNDEFVESRIGEHKKRRMSPAKLELEKKIKLETRKVRTKEVKPNYKKKVRDAAEKVKRKHKREIIKKDIRRQREERYKANKGSL